MQNAAFAMRRWSFKQDDPSSITTLLDRVNRERGHFREITGTSLQEELATEGALTLSDSDDDASTEAGEGTADGGQHGKPSSREDLFRAKYEMLEKISYAHNEVMMALDFVSLLGSKDLPAARQSMSQYLKDNVPAGTLGSDVWKRDAIDSTQEAQNLRLAQNVRLEAFEKSADSILAAAKTFESNVKSEVQYWNQINAITMKGWSVCRLPGQKHKLGVRYGLSESAPRFTQAGIAALDVDDDGDISVVVGAAAKAKVLRVAVHRSGTVTGQSTHLGVSDHEAGALESRIRGARDSLFNEELFYEMERESRSLVSRGVRAYGSTLSIPLDDATNSSISFELADSRVTSTSTESSRSQDDSLAQGVLCLAKLLLCKAHDNILMKRSQIPPPLTEKTNDRALLNVLRPVILFLGLDKARRVINDKVRTLSTLLQQAGLENEATLARLDLSNFEDVLGTEALTNHLLGSWSCEASIYLQTVSAPATVTVTTSPNRSILDDSALSFNVQQGNSPPLGFTLLEQALLALDHCVARTISLAIAAQVDAGWKVDDVSADMTRDVSAASGNGQREASAIVDTASSEPKLSLVWIDGRRDWTAGQTVGEPFLEVWKNVCSG